MLELCQYFIADPSKVSATLLDAGGGQRYLRVRGTVRGLTPEMTQMHFDGLEADGQSVVARFTILADNASHAGNQLHCSAPGETTPFMAGISDIQIRIRYHDGNGPKTLSLIMRQAGDCGAED